MPARVMNTSPPKFLAETCGLTASARRYYEQQGLIHSSARHGLRRQYLPNVLLQLGLINMGKAAGFSLTEIAAMFGRDGLPNLPRAELNDRADALERRMREIEILSRALRHVADCPAPSHLECPSFQKLMRVTMKAQ